VLLLSDRYLQQGKLPIHALLATVLWRSTERVVWLNSRRICSAVGRRGSAPFRVQR
jgi:hypothetical protein